MKFRPFILFLAVSTVSLTATAADESQVQFSRDILPLLSENCFFCHGPDDQNRQADLRLDTEDGALQAIDRSAPDESALLERILSDDADVMMPPPDSNRRLTSDQKELLRRWIREGAKWGRHWSFEPLQLPPVPSTDSKIDAPVRNPIDAFVQRELAASNLTPAEEADRRTLLRRVTLDLTGLPPTPEEVQAFVTDDRDDAYERVVDRLLASQHYGERMAWDWLDAARYADSNGYQGDRERTMWPWRDWVISAFNRNLPFDQFSTYQLAGDLLPDSTFEQQLATGFCRNHMINGEGGRIPEENRVDYVMDMSETMGTVWLGLTLNCCRCHDHKYDPLTQEEYYQFFDFFNQTPVTGGGGDPQTPPNLAVPSSSQQQQRDQLETQIARSEQALETRRKELLPKQADWEAKLLAAGRRAMWQRVRPIEYSADHQTLTLLEDDSLLAEGKNPEQDNYRLVFQPTIDQLTAIRLDALRDSRMTDGGLARSDSGNFVLTEIAASLVTPAGEVRLKIDSAEATFEQGGLKIEKAFDGDPSSGWAVYNGRPIDTGHAAVFRFAEPVALAEGALLVIELQHQSVHRFHNLGRFRIALTDRAKPSLESEDGALHDLVRIPDQDRSDEQRQQIRQQYLQSNAQFAKAKADLDAAKDRLQKLIAGLPKVMVMQDQSQRRTSFVLDRGLYNEPTEHKVQADTPDSLPAMTVAGRAANRLDLAQWLFSDRHPLTARVTVNRFWQQLFGIGLVKTVEDFGVQAEYPIHKDLLDWLAADFRDHGWDVKRLMKTIVTSHTYRQSSAIRSVQQDSRQVSLAELDPDNRLLARATRFRLPAWMLRDQALAASGLLNAEIGGPPVNTYQPAGVWEEATFGKKSYRQDSGDRLYRRSLYIFWRRIIAPTMFFDNASRQTCTVKALLTNTPLHALLTFNETTYVESARHLAQTILTDSQLMSDEDRLQQIFVRILGRPASAAEVGVLLPGLTRNRQQYSNAPAEAKRLLAVGESARNESVNEIEHAAWTAVCLTVLNTDEALNRE